MKDYMKDELDELFVCSHCRGSISDKLPNIRRLENDLKNIASCIKEAQERVNYVLGIKP